MTVAERRLTAPLTAVMATACGVAVANLYYLQPLLHQLRGEFSVSASVASIPVTLVQVGYAVGLVLVAPLGDRLARRPLAVAVFLTASGACALAASAPSFAVLSAVLTLVGLASVGTQVLLPLAADLAEPEQRGRVIARVMTGLLTGVLLSRTASGLIAQAAGWRAVYWSAAAALALCAAVLARVLPDEAPRERPAYRELLAGPFRMLARYRALRRRALYGALIFAAISVIWTTLSFHLGAAPFRYSRAQIGLFGLFGVAGVLAANVAGHHADRQRAGPGTVVTALALTASFAVFLAGGSLAAIALGLVLMDAGMQGTQILNQSVIYGLDPQRRARVNSAYMMSCFTGASIGSYAGGLVYQHDGWTGCCALGGALGAALLALAARGASAGAASRESR